MKNLAKLNNQAGVAAVELAIILPLIVMILFGAIEFGLLFYNKAVITNATRVAARAGTSGVDDTEMRNIIGSYCNANLINLGGNNSLDTATDIQIDGPDGDNDITVTIDYGYNFVFADLIGLNMNNLKIHADTVMRME